MEDIEFNCDQINEFKNSILEHCNKFNYSDSDIENIKNSLYNINGCNFKILFRNEIPNNYLQENNIIYYISNRFIIYNSFDMINAKKYVIVIFK